MLEKLENSDETSNKLEVYDFNQTLNQADNAESQN